MSKKRKKENKVGKVEVTVFYRMILKVTSSTFTVFYLLGISHWVQPTPQGRKLDKTADGEITGSQFRACLSYSQFAKMKQLKTSFFKHEIQ